MLLAAEFIDIDDVHNIGTVQLMTAMSRRIERIPHTSAIVEPDDAYAVAVERRIYCQADIALRTVPFGTVVDASAARPRGEPDVHARSVSMRSPVGRSACFAMSFIAPLSSLTEAET